MEFIDPKLLHYIDYTSLNLDDDSIPDEIDTSIGTDEGEYQEVKSFIQEQQLTDSNLMMFSLSQSQAVRHNPIEPKKTSFMVTIKVDSEKLIGSIQEKFTPIDQLKANRRFDCPKRELVYNTDSSQELEQEWTEEIEDEYNKENVPPATSRQSPHHKTKRLSLQYSRCSVEKLAKLLNLQDYHIVLTKRIELDVLKTFEGYCNFKLGHRTWVRTTTREEREREIEILYRIFNPIYGLDHFQLELILKRGTYMLMQSRQRKLREKSQLSLNKSL